LAVASTGVSPDVETPFLHHPSGQRPKGEDVIAAAPAIPDEETCFLDSDRPAARCKHDRCAFWQDEREECIPKRLGLEEQAEARPELADWLRKVRSELSTRRLEIRPERLPPYALLPDPGFRPLFRH
jgi:hypothetical protein